MAEYTLPHLASVIGIVDSQTGQHVGSAIRCRVREQNVVVTAAHVVRQARRDYPGLAISAGYGRPPCRVGEETFLDEASNLAFIVTPPDYPSEGLEYWPATRIDEDHERLATDYLFVHGFPQTRSRSSPLLGGVVSKSLPYGAMQRTEPLPEGLKPFEFAVYFDPRSIRVEAGEPDLLPDPRGMSGCPVWRIGASGRRARDWSPEWCVLVGVVTQWRQDAEALVATGSPKLLEILNKWMNNQSTTAE